MNSDKTQLLLLGVTSFLLQICFAMINLALVFYLRETYSLSAATIGLALSYNQISYCFFAIVLSNWITAFKPRYVIMIGLSGITLCILSIILIHSYIAVLVTIVFYGGFLSLVWPSIESWLARGKEEAFLNKSMGIFNFSWSSGAAISTYIGGLLIEINLRLPFYLSVIILFFIILSLYIVTSLVPSLRSSEAENDYIKNNKLKDNSTFLRYYSWAGIFVGYIVIGAINNIFPIYAKEVLNFSESTVGGLLSIRGIVTCFMFYLLTKTSFWHFKRYIIIGVQILIALIVLASRSFTSVFSLSIFFFSFGLLFPFVYVMSIFHGASGAINKTKRMIIHEVLISLGVVVGSVAGGILYDHFSYSQMMLIFFFVISIAIVLEITIYLIRMNNLNKIKNPNYTQS
ncbi:MAG: MFS transporter [Spirochaetaceae bacterium]|nr:MFS transporter [Spirochaetaceae bacterium]